MGSRQLHFGRYILIHIHEDTAKISLLFYKCRSIHIFNEKMSNIMQISVYQRHLFLCSKFAILWSDVPKANPARYTFRALVGKWSAGLDTLQNDCQITHSASQFSLLTIFWCTHQCTHGQIQITKAYRIFSVSLCFYWCARQDSNPRPLGS